MAEHNSQYHQEVRIDEMRESFTKPAGDYDPKQAQANYSAGQVQAVPAPFDPVSYSKQRRVGTRVPESIYDYGSSRH